MRRRTSNQQLQFEGFLKTPELWLGTSILELEQLKFIPKQEQLNNEFPVMRLGMLVEQFLLHAIAQDPLNEIIAKNLQIIEAKITLGELDALLNLNDQLIHLEIVYKFYLFDPKISQNELECWIGPNRRDSLVEKLKKLRNNQLPLLYHPKTNEELVRLGHQADDFKQKVNFKAQLFTPYNSEKKSYTNVNNDCIEGVYICGDQLNKLNKLNDLSFHIPTKLDWLTIPHQNVHWVNYNEFEAAINELLVNKISPMCWSKADSGELKKFFVVWWK